MAAPRTLIDLPPSARRGEVITVRATLGHMMESGFRVGADGRTLPRDIVTSFECQLDGSTVFAATFFPAIAANPFVSFTLKCERSGVLSFAWRGDNGFAHGERAALNVVA